MICADIHFSDTTAEQTGRGGSYADDKDNECLATLNERLDVAVLCANLGDDGFARPRIISMQRAAIQQGEQDVSTIMKRMPFCARVVSFLAFVDRDANDNNLPVAKSVR